MPNQTDSISRVRSSAEGDSSVARTKDLNLSHKPLFSMTMPPPPRLVWLQTAMVKLANGTMEGGRVPHALPNCAVQVTNHNQGLICVNTPLGMIIA